MTVSSAAGLSNFEILRAKTKKCREKTSDLDLVLVHAYLNSPFAKCQEGVLETTTATATRTSLPSLLSMLKVPSFNRCVGFVLNMSKKWQGNLHALFTMKDLSRSLLTSQKKLRLHPSVKSP